MHTADSDYHVNKFVCSLLRNLYMIYPLGGSNSPSDHYRWIKTKLRDEGYGKLVMRIAELTGGTHDG